MVVMTRIRVPIATLGVTVVALIVVTATALSAAAADLPFGPSRAPEAAALPPGAPFDLHVSGMLPGDELPPRAIDLPAGHPGPFRLRAATSGSDELARSLHVRVASAAGAVLYDGPLAWASASGGAPDGGERLMVFLRLDPSAGNAVQGAQLAIRWDLQVVSGPD